MIEFKNDKELDEKINKTKTITNVISAIRAIVGFVDVTFIILLISLGDYLIYGILSGVFFIAFLLVMILTNRFYNELDKLKLKKGIYEAHLRRRSGKYNSFTDTGFDLITKEDYKLLDLDVFGKNSIFQYLNVCKTKYGRLNLANRLKNGCVNKTPNAVKELAETEEVINIESGIQSFDSNAKNLDYDAMLNTFGKKIALKPLMFVPLLSLIALIVYIPFIFTLNFNPYVPLVFVFTNIFSAKLLIQNDVFNLDSTSYYNLCDSYLSTIEEVEKIEFKDEHLKDIKNSLIENKFLLKKAKSIFNLLAVRKNLMMNLILNIFIFDFWTIFIYNHKTTSLDKLKDVFENVGELEALVSLSIIGIDNTVYSIPEEGNGIRGIDMYHPLVQNCIPNSIEFDGGIILTGSNMSGKTTFMRVLGINQLLSNAGGIVPAIEYKTGNYPVLTSLRANDMLSEGVSTFYAEILRMKKINQAIGENKCLILVDEIFKGTNTNDRIYASEEVIKNLNNNNAIFIISTHDFELCDVGNIVNYHFNEEYNDDKISFDYKIKEGKCETKNAIYLLKMANII